MTNLDKSLDDIIREKQTKRPTRPSNNRPVGVGRRPLRSAGPVRRQPFARLHQQILPRSIAARAGRPAPMFSYHQLPSFTPAPPVGPKVRIKGLDPNWEAKDIRQIFMEQGFNVGKIWVHWDRSGRSEGRCDMALPTMQEARAVVQEMDGAEVDGFPLTLTLGSGPSPRSTPHMGAFGGGFGGGFGDGFGGGFGGYGAPRFNPTRTRTRTVTGMGRGMGPRPSGNGSRGRGGVASGRGGRGNRAERDRPTKTEEQLDEELQHYNKRDAMQE
eukprot:NODE_3353_length_983_cov_32.915888_g3207_i0.p1 GENE.NODE_3353_length_983_cov_32.915888_g3207_i0~~NODE_3353_length_983_cov_32.915888_g3207_i0.p1  ORF type:complete len:271 (-),score=44.51 NODE_3353_length_983_cov_32.915888_g3207_i0:122-934(-)